MKKGFAVIVVLIMALSLVGFKAPNAYAQGFGVSWDSSFQVLNLGDVDAAIDIYYYNQDGTLAIDPVHDTVLVGESNPYFPVHAPDGFNGSVVVSSSQPIAVISNLVINTTAAGLGSYVAFPNGAPIIFFPLVMKCNPTCARSTTTFNVQNTGMDEAEVTVDFTAEPGGGYADIPDIVETIPMGAAATYDLNVLTEFTGVDKWVGSVTVSVTDAANDSVAGVATTVDLRNAGAYQLGTYNAFVKGSADVVLPLIQENNNNNRTSINCQNIGTEAITVTVTYIPETGYAAKADETRPNIVPNGTAVFLQDNTGAVPTWVGAAQVTGEGSPLACVVNQQNAVRGRLSSYEGFDPADATDTVVLPLIQSRNGSTLVFTSINLATADGLAHEITCDFQPGPGYGDPPNMTDTGASVVFLTHDLFGDGTTSFVGGATCTTTDSAPLFAIVNQSRQAAPQFLRDILSSYDGFNVP